MTSKDNIYQIKVTLLHTSPPIWRRILVKSSYTLSNLHAIIQVAMGWQNCHMHHFIVGKKYYGLPDPMGWLENEDERKVRLTEVLPRRKSKMKYEYDFGDSWIHEIVLEDILPADPDTVYPVVVKGRMACPPEDCGGIWGFYNFIDAIQDPDHPDHEDIKEWYVDPFDPAAFDIDDANRIFRRR